MWDYVINKQYWIIWEKNKVELYFILCIQGNYSHIKNFNVKHKNKIQNTGKSIEKYLYNLTEGKIQNPGITKKMSRYDKTLNNYMIKYTINKVRRQAIFKDSLANYSPWTRRQFV